MRGHGRGLVVSCALIVMGVGAACNTAQREVADDRPPPASSPSATTAAQSPCPAPALRPGYLPAGMRPVDRAAVIAQPERTRSWQDGDALVQLLEGFSADHGDDPSVRDVKVRGDDSANLSSVPTSEGDVLLVDWAESTRCGHKQYAVATKHVSEEETVKIARSLRDG